MTVVHLTEAVCAGAGDTLDSTSAQLVDNISEGLARTQLTWDSVQAVRVFACTSSGAALQQGMHSNPLTLGLYLAVS